ncbi:MAG: hypothetical protein HGA85_03850 [Nanoarchaeota archaeon]|nr:hypothetical protein [Nanoarchaeota archaeon]
MSAILIGSHDAKFVPIGSDAYIEDRLIGCKVIVIRHETIGDIVGHFGPLKNQLCLDTIKELSGQVYQDNLPRIIDIYSISEMPCFIHGWEQYRNCLPFPTRDPDLALELISGMKELFPTSDLLLHPYESVSTFAYVGRVPLFWKI